MRAVSNYPLAPVVPRNFNELPAYLRNAKHFESGAEPETPSAESTAKRRRPNPLLELDWLYDWPMGGVAEDGKQQPPHMGRRELGADGGAVGGAMSGVRGREMAAAAVGEEGAQGLGGGGLGGAIEWLAASPLGGHASFASAGGGECGGAAELERRARVEEASEAWDAEWRRRFEEWWLAAPIGGGGGGGGIHACLSSLAIVLTTKLERWWRGGGGGASARPSTEGASTEEAACE